MPIEDLIARLDAIDAVDVPAQCLLIADDAEERGADGNGWRAIGVLRKCPLDSAEYSERELGHCWLDPDSPMKDRFGSRCVLQYEWLAALAFPSPYNRSGFLTAAAKAFVSLSETKQREILARGTEFPCPSDPRSGEASPLGIFAPFQV